MLGRFVCVVSLVLAAARCGAAEWSLADHLDQVLVYTSDTLEEFMYTPDRIQTPRGGLLMRSVFPQKDGGLRPYAPGMAVNGKVRAGQFLLSGASSFRAACAEFVVVGGTKITVDYGLCDEAVKHGNEGTRLVIELHAQDKVLTDEIIIAENRWSQKTITLPQAERVLVRLLAYRRNPVSTNWTGLVMRGHGRLGTCEDARMLSPNRDKIGPLDLTLKPSPHRATARPRYDVLFYRDRPLLSYAAKGHRHGVHGLQAAVGVNTFYVEGMTFGRYWAEGAEGVVVPEASRTCLHLKQCQRHDMPFKLPMSMAHCTPFLPSWLVKKEGLGFEGHKMRRGGPHHASIFKRGTLRFHKQGLRGWIKPFLDQASIFVFSQEDDPSHLDGHSKEALANWRGWLRRRFGDDFRAFSAYVGGIRDCEGFAAAPNPKQYNADPRVGFPMRLCWLKLLWVQEAFADYMENLFAFVREIAPGVPLTQRYVNTPCGVYLSRRLKADYSYMFGHLSSEGIPNNYGIGKKSWTGIYAHCGCLPLPRGGSIGKTLSRDIRRGPMTEAEWNLNAYTAVANGVTGFEYQPFFATWGPRWSPAALYSKDMKMTGQGRLSASVMKKLLSYSKYMMHYERHEDVAVFHDAAFNCGAFGGPWSQSKAGLYTLIRETGFHADVLTAWDMTAEHLRGKKVLVLAGTTSIAPEIQEAIREYVRRGGTLLAVFCADGAGFPGCNSYAYACKPRESAAARSFEKPKALAHLGDVLGIAEGGGLATRQAVRSDEHGAVSFASFNALVAEKRWVGKPSCCEKLTPAKDTRVIATFDAGSPAVIEHAFGKGRAISFAFDLGLIANNLTVDPMYKWWSDLLLSLGCRKAIDTKNWRVEGGAWHDDDGNRVVFLINHDPDRPQTAALPDGRTVVLAPAGVRAETGF